ncbi:hypothetical protein [Brevibacterium atlanticum]|uniref:hypothetical protein n=1 Tax=Brevibacterium atlanticum TaxID=2697563 RepID=UPI001423D5EC|nr:hypothetical protein [Brevibacterium atlanticum]
MNFFIVDFDEQLSKAPALVSLYPAQGFLHVIHVGEDESLEVPGGRSIAFPKVDSVRWRVILVGALGMNCFVSSHFGPFQSIGAKVTTISSLTSMFEDCGSLLSPHATHSVVPYFFFVGGVASLYPFGGAISACAQPWNLPAPSLQGTPR